MNQAQKMKMMKRRLEGEKPEEDAIQKAAKSLSKNDQMKVVKALRSAFKA